eukprot:15328581-Ditylum_brightwellii.AAC.1
MAIDNPSNEDVTKSTAGREVVMIFQGVISTIMFKPINATWIKITTSLVKFNAAMEGKYEMEDGQITLRFFENEKDAAMAEESIKENLDFLESLGNKLPFLFRCIVRLITRIPYKKNEVKGYAKRFSEKTLLSEQHLAGGCVVGDVIDKGLQDPSETGKASSILNKTQ